MTPQSWIRGALLGLAHAIFHRSTTQPTPNCYLQDLFTAPEARGQGVARALIEAQNMLEEKDQQIKELAPRAGAWEMFCGSSGDMSVADVAKALNSRRGVDTGRDRLFKMMQELGWTTHCHGYWEPMQYAVERGYLAVKVNMPRWPPNH